MEFLENPRRALRVPVRCDALMALPGGGYWSSPTQNLGAAGCQLVTSEKLTVGTELTLELTAERVAGPVTVVGSVVWVSERPPWHTGLAFTSESAAGARPFFQALLDAHPGLEAHAFAPERLPLDAPLAPGPVPRVEPELAGEEAAVLAALGEGMTAHALRAKLGARFDALAGPLFALLGRRQVVIGPPDAAAAAAWKDAIERAGR